MSDLTAEGNGDGRESGCEQGARAEQSFQQSTMTNQREATDTNERFRHVYNQDGIPGIYRSSNSEPPCLFQNHMWLSPNLWTSLPVGHYTPVRWDDLRRSQVPACSSEGYRLLSNDLILDSNGELQPYAVPLVHEIFPASEQEVNMAYLTPEQQMVAWGIREQTEGSPAPTLSSGGSAAHPLLSFDLNQALAYPYYFRGVSSLPVMTNNPAVERDTQSAPLLNQMEPPRLHQAMRNTQVRSIYEVVSHMAIQVDDENRRQIAVAKEQAKEQQRLQVQKQEQEEKEQRMAAEVQRAIEAQATSEQRNGELEVQLEIAKHKEEMMISEKERLAEELEIRRLEIEALMEDNRRLLRAVNSK